MKVTDVRAYAGQVDEDGLVAAYDLTVADLHLYYANGVLVSNSKRVSMLDVNAMMAHGATENLRDAGAIRGQRDEHWWLQFMQGYNPTHVKVPLVYQKFHAQLQASGIHVKREGHQTHVMELTDRDVKGLAGDRLLRHGETVHFDHDLKPVPGGLFDPQLTGGHGGKLWSAIKLSEPMPNPVMEEPLRRLLGLTQKQFEGVLSGEHELPRFGKGPDALRRALEDVNLHREIGVARAQVHASSAAKRDEAVRRLKYLKGALEKGIHPKEWLLSHAPVLPPVFRPVSLMGQSGLPLVSDANYLYKELHEANQNLGDMKKELGEGGVGPERLALYRAFKAVTGLGDPVSTKSQEKGIKGLLKQIFGSSPKFGTVQRKLLSSTVDNVGRSVITPNPDYDIDTVGLPENQAFEVYKRFIVRRLKRRGMPLSQAMQHVADKSDLARDILQEEMDNRPVYINRAPVLHKFGVLAFRPKLVKGDVMQVSPLIVTGFNADFDGDAMQFHVPTSEGAVKEAYDRMLPSKNLISPADFKTPVHAPVHEYLGGLYHATASKSERPPRYFRSKADAIAAHRRGEVGADDQVVILG